MIPLFIIIEIIGFAGAALIHFGVFISGYEHEKARIAELVIATVLLIGFITILLNPDKKKTISFIVQGLALLGTFIGMFTIIIGVGPQSLPDIIYHICISIILVAGLIFSAGIKN